MNDVPGCTSDDTVSCSYLCVHVHQSSAGGVDVIVYIRVRAPPH